MLQPRDLKGRTAVSHVRWSSGGQTKGDSLRRQKENAADFCAKYGLGLSDTLSDEAVSAFKGKNLDLRASFGRFIEDVRTGKISSDMVLIVENMDRVTRVKPTLAIRYFLDLLDTGLTVVTLTDERVHTREDYDENFASLMMSLMAMQAANEYSKKISHRVGSEWNNRANKARVGRVKMSKVPFWIDQETQQLNDRAEIALRIFGMAKDGVGQASIAATLNAEGIAGPVSAAWHKSAVQDTLKSKVAYGSLVVKGEEVPDYFPPIVTEEAWLSIQHRSRVRTNNPQVGNTANLFPRLLYCAHCGSAMNVTTSRFGKWRYLICSGKNLKRTDCVQPNWRYNEFEKEFLDRIGFLAVPIPTDDKQPDRTAELVDAIAALEAKRETILAGFGETNDAGIRSILLKQAGSVSSDIEIKKVELMKARENMARFQEMADTVVDFEADIERINDLARDDRKEAQRLVANLVERIELESDSKLLRRAIVTMRDGHSHNIVFDDTGQP